MSDSVRSRLSLRLSISTALSLIKGQCFLASHERICPEPSP